MYKITKEEAASLLQKTRQVRLATEEMIAFLEHMIQLQEENSRNLSYDPDDYLRREGDAPLYFLTTYEGKEADDRKEAQK